MGIALKILAKQEGRLVATEALTSQVVALQKRQDESIAETKRHINAVQRLWVRLAKKHGWLEDEDLETS